MEDQRAHPEKDIPLELDKEIPEDQLLLMAIATRQPTPNINITTACSFASTAKAVTFAQRMSVRDKKGVSDRSLQQAELPIDNGCEPADHCNTIDTNPRNHMCMHAMFLSIVTCTLQFILARSLLKFPNTASVVGMRTCIVQSYKLCGHP